MLHHYFVKKRKTIYTQIHVCVSVDVLAALDFCLDDRHIKREGKEGKRDKEKERERER